MSDFVVTAHAFERLEERFPEWIESKSEYDQATMIHEEVMDALDDGRHANVPPVELSPASERWKASEKGSYYVWTADKKRGYLMREVKGDLLVVTVLAGCSREEALRRVQR
jgi:hypothetical protein